MLGALLLALATQASAVEPSERLANPQLEARAEAIGRTLRCLVCQNESIEESNASLAHDVRVLLRQLLLRGDSDAQARDAIVARYGEFVLLKPPVQPATYVLWFGPPALLVLGFIGTAAWLQRRPVAARVPAPLTPEEVSRLNTLLREADDDVGGIGVEQDAWRGGHGGANGKDAAARGGGTAAHGKDTAAHGSGTMGRGSDTMVGGNDVVGRGSDTMVGGNDAAAGVRDARTRGKDVDGGPSPAMTLEDRADARNHT